MPGFRATVLLIGAFVPPATAGETAAPRYTTVAASADGIGKMYQGREIAQVMSFHGAQWLERSERNELEFPYEMLAAITRALKPGGRLAPA